MKSAHHQPHYPICQPYLLVLYIAHSIYSANRYYFPPAALVVPVALLFGFLTVALAVCALTRCGIHKGIVAISGFLVLNYTYAATRDTVTWTLLPVSPAAMIYSFALLALLVTVYRLSRPGVRRVTQVITVATIVLVGISLFNESRTQLQARRLHEAGNPADEKLFRRYRSMDLRSPMNARDFYFIVIDRYPGKETLWVESGVDNADFYGKMRQMGFDIMEASRSNYGVTSYSISSMLNMDYYENVAADGYDEETSRVALFFMAQGYQFVFLPSNWITTTTNRHADVVLNPYPRQLEVADMKRLFQRIMFFERSYVGWLWDVYHYVFMDIAIPDHSIERLQERVQNLELDARQRFNAQFHAEREYVQLARTHVPATFEALKEVPQIPGNKYVFAHINHWEHIHEGYVESLYAVNAMIADLCAVLLRESDVPPVIVILSDHGTKPLVSIIEANRDMYARYAQYPESLTQDDINASWYHLNILHMYHLPEGGRAALYPSITPVNAWRGIKNHYFGTEYERLEDRSFWKWRHDDAMIEIK